MMALRPESGQYHVLVHIDRHAGDLASVTRPIEGDHPDVRPHFSQFVLDKNYVTSE